VRDGTACCDNGHHSKTDFPHAIGHSAENVQTPLDADEIISDLSDNEVGNENKDASATVTEATLCHLP
jgi:hypothetical protein